MQIDSDLERSFFLADMAPEDVDPDGPDPAHRSSTPHSSSDVGELDILKIKQEMFSPRKDLVFDNVQSDSESPSRSMLRARSCSSDMISEDAPILTAGGLFLPDIESPSQGKRPAQSGLFSASANSNDRSVLCISILFLLASDPFCRCSRVEISVERTARYFHLCFLAQPN